MRINLVPIKVTIRQGLDAQGRRSAQYPAFNQVTPANRGNMDWSYFIDAYGSGWAYDSLSGFGNVDAENPDPDTHIGCFLVPEPFAIEADALFADVELVDEVEWERFYDDRAAVSQPEELVDEQALKLVDEWEKKNRNDPRIAKAKDPDDLTPGIRKNHRKTWADWKAKSGMEIIADRQKP